MSNINEKTQKRKPTKKLWGGGKRSRRQHSKKAAQARWQSNDPDKHVLETEEQELEGFGVFEHTLFAHGDAEIPSCSHNLQAGQNIVQNGQPNEECSARKKMGLMKEYIDPANDNIVADDTDSNERCFMDLGTLKGLFSAVACQECGGSLDVAFGDKMGYSREIRLACQSCPFTRQQYSCQRIRGSTDVTVGFEVNDSMVMCFNELGCGEAAMRKFSAIMRIPGFAHRTYHRLSKKVGNAHSQVTANVLNAAVAAVRRTYADVNDDIDDNEENDNDDTGDTDSTNSSDVDSVASHDLAGDDHVMMHSDSNISSVEGDSDSDRGNFGDHNTDSGSSDEDDNDAIDNDIVDVWVSFDGTWHKRGFTSNYGVGIVIDVHTGLVLDFIVLSKYCHACALNKKRNMTDEEREEWKREHRPQCSKNYEGSSKGMEKEAALQMWGRSIRKNRMRYTYMLSDGDSVAFKAVSDANFYPVKKLECINHCDKRMGTALRKKAKEEKLGGRRHGALTAKTCNILQSYYRNAIVKNLNKPEEMKEAIWASFMHCMSTDDNPQHEKCPHGPDSWCFFNKAVASGVPPPPHKQNVGTPLAHHVAEAIRPIYDRMSHNTLLEKIQHGRTQNANECVNGQIWARCPKTIHVGAGRVNAAVASAVSHFNQGCSHLSQVLGELGVSPGVNLQQFETRQDLKRCKRGDLFGQVEIKRTRRAKGQAKRTNVIQIERQEGPTYGPGLLADTE
ncbi:uncharacterized protein [Littorina saxatilis]